MMNDKELEDMIKEFLSQSALMCHDQAKALSREHPRGLLAKDMNEYISMKAKARAFLQAQKYVQKAFLEYRSGVDYEV